MALTIKNRYTIKPAQETPIIKISPSESDQINPITHTPTVYFYKLPTTTATTTDADDYPSFASAVETLKTSLSKVLVPFYPLAGRLNWLPGNQNRVEINCNSMGAEIYEAESELCIDDYGDFRPTPELRKLIPNVDYLATPIHDIPLLMVQITQFSCGGRSIGVAISHIVTDGVSALHFISEWARIARGLEIALHPYLDRAKPWQNTSKYSLSEVKFDHPEFEPLPLLLGSQNNHEERRKASEVTLLKLTKAQIENIKNKANADTTDKNLSRQYSRYEAVTGHIWKTACKARNHRPEQLTSVRVMVAASHRINPPIPVGYFGNAVFPTHATGNAGDLVRNPLSYASSRIRESIEKMTDEYIRSAIAASKVLQDLNKHRIFQTFGGTQQGMFYGNPNLDLTSWLSLPVLHGADFGWGKEIYMGPGALVYDGKCCILPGREEDDAGSLVLALRMQVDHLESFKKLLYQDI